MLRQILYFSSCGGFKSNVSDDMSSGDWAWLGLSPDSGLHLGRSGVRGSQWPVVRLEICKVWGSQAASTVWWRATGGRAGKVQNGHKIVTQTLTVIVYSSRSRAFIPNKDSAFAFFIWLFISSSLCISLIGISRTQIFSFPNAKLSREKRSMSIRLVMRSWVVRVAA